MYVVIVGGGRTGSHLAHVLLEEQHRVTLIENRPEMLVRLHRELPTETILEGCPTDPAVLAQADLGAADALAACYPDDADNLVVCHLARSRFGVRKVIGRVSSPRNAWLYDEKFGVDVAVQPSEMLAAVIEEQMVLGQMVTLLKLRTGAYSLVEDVVAPGSVAEGRALKDVPLPANCVVVAILRGDELVVPRGWTTFTAGDGVIALTDRAGRESLARLFAPAS